jgi:hypothetical protein
MTGRPTVWGDDLDRAVTFHRFPEAHWSHLRTTHPIDSVFATVRLRTNAAKRFKKTKIGANYTEVDTISLRPPCSPEFGYIHPFPDARQMRIDRPLRHQPACLKGMYLKECAGSAPVPGNPVPAGGRRTFRVFPFTLFGSWSCRH